METARFECVVSKSLATTTTIILVALVLVVVFMLMLFLWIGGRTGWPGHLKTIAIATNTFFFVAVASAITFSYLLSPKWIGLSSQAVIIHRALWPIKIPLKDISSIRRVDPSELKGTIKTMGSDGLFARIGHFHSKKLGNFRMYSTNSSRAVLIDTDERFVISPERTDDFIRDVTARIERAETH
jgi:hypothetical protein